MFEILALLLTLLSGLFNFLSPAEKNLADDPRLSNIVNQCFELTQDAFVYNWVVHKSQGIAAVGSRNPCLPLSVEEYSNNPQNWKSTPHCEEARAKFGDDLAWPEISQVLDAGTQVSVERVVRSGGTGGVTYTLLGTTSNSQEEIRLNDLFAEKAIVLDEAPTPFEPIADFIQTCK